MNKKEAVKLAQIFASDCIAFRVRALNRVITNLYDAALKPFGITVNQTTILAMLARVGEAGPGNIGQALVMEKSTVSRNLDRMRKNGWIKAVAKDSANTQSISVTTVGRKLLAVLYPDWEKAQVTAARLLGDQGVAAIQSLHETVRKTTRSA